MALQARHVCAVGWENEEDPQPPQLKAAPCWRATDPSPVMAVSRSCLRRAACQHRWTRALGPCQAASQPLGGSGAWNRAQSQRGVSPTEKPFWRLYAIH